MGSVIVVDDDEDIRNLVVRRLERAGHEVRAAADGVEALELVHEAVPDLLVLDWMMPRLDGIGVAERLSTTMERPRILMLTARAQESDVERALAAGADGYLLKPFLAGDLLARAEELLAQA